MATLESDRQIEVISRRQLLGLGSKLLILGLTPPIIAHESPPPTPSSSQTPARKTPVGNITDTGKDTRSDAEIFVFDVAFGTIIGLSGGGLLRMVLGLDDDYDPEGCYIGCAMQGWVGIAGATVGALVAKNSIDNRNEKRQ